MKPKPFFYLLILVVLLFSGCAALDMKHGLISFESPAEVLKLRELEPNAEELRGVTLRLKAPESGISRAEEHLKIYSRVHGTEGLGLDLRQKIEMTFTPGTGNENYVQRTVTVFDKGAGQITEEAEISPRGEIIRFIGGHHESEAGKFQVLNLSRSAVYPEGRVKIGDKWTYDEKMEVKLESFWVKEKNPEPYELKAESTLTGFAEVLGRRCAVIKTISTQTKKISLKVLFKTVNTEITTQLEKTDYLDYARGLLAARVSKAQSRSVFPNLKMEDEGVSQSIYQTTDSA